MQDVVSAGLSAAMGAMSKATEERFLDLEQNVQQMQIDQMNMSAELHGQAATISSRGTDIQKMKRDLQAQQQAEQARIIGAERIRTARLQVLQEMKDLRDKLRHGQLTSPPGTSSRASNSQAPSAASIPHELRMEGPYSAAWEKGSIPMFSCRGQRRHSAQQIFLQSGTGIWRPTTGTQQYL